MLVDVVAELHGAVARHPAGHINPGDRHPLRQVDDPEHAGGDAGVDRRAIPARHVVQDPGGEVAHIVDTGAAVRIEAVVVGEQPARIGVVHVDRIRVRHVDLEIAERVPAAGILADGKVRRAVRRPVDRLRTDLLVMRAEHAHVHAGNIVRIPTHAREDLVLSNRERNRPGRVEVDRGDVGGERRRRLVDLAHDHAIAPLDFFVATASTKAAGMFTTT